MPFKPIEAFKVGTHIDASGVKRVFTEADLQQMVASFDPLKFRVPMVVGHPPEIDAPAVGLIGAVEYRDGSLFVTPEHIHPDFLKELEVNRAFTDVSISVYPPDDARNPVNGKWTLKHLGLLGATAPAVKGLEGIPNPLQYGEAGGAFCFEAFKLPEDFVKLINKESLSMTEEEIKAMQAQLAALTAANKKAEEEKSAMQAQIEAAKLGEAMAEGTAFCESQIRDGKLTPAVKSSVVALYAHLKTHGGATDINFGEGDNQVKTNPVALFKQIIEGLPKAVEFKEVAGAGVGGIPPKPKEISSVGAILDSCFNKGKK